MCATEARRRGRTLRAGAALACATLALAAGAQQPTREQEQIRRLRQQVQQLQSELATAQQAAQASRADADKRAGVAQSEAARAKRTASAGAARIAELESKLQALGTDHAALQARAATLATEREQDRASLTQLRGRADATGLRLQRREGEFEALLARFKLQNDALAMCARHNQSLREVSLDLLNRWQRMDWRDAVAAKEPFVQGERVRIENLVQGYEDQIDRASLATPPAAQAAGRAGSPPP